MDSELQDWGLAYQELCELIKPSEGTGGVPEVGHCDLWHEQIDYLPEEYPWPPGALFFNFNATDIQTNGLQVQDMVFEIGVIYCFDTLADSFQDSETKDIALAFIKHLRSIHKVLQGTSGANFSSLDRVGFRRVPAPQYLICYEQRYRCIIRDQSALPVNGTAVLNKVSVNNNSRPVVDEEPLYKTE